MATCGNMKFEGCGSEITWRKEGSRSVAYNPDGTKHQCKGAKARQNGTSEKKQPEEVSPWMPVLLMKWVEINTLGALLLTYREEYGQGNKGSKYIGAAFLEKMPLLNQLPMSGVMVRFNPDGSPLADIDLSKAVRVQDTVPDALAGKKDLSQNLPPSDEMKTGKQILDEEKAAETTQNNHFANLSHAARDGEMKAGYQDTAPRECVRCKKTVIFRKFYNEKNARKLNLDGTPHNCGQEEIVPLSNAPVTDMIPTGAQSADQSSVPLKNEKNGDDKALKSRLAERDGKQQPDKSTSPSPAAIDRQEPAQPPRAARVSIGCTINLQGYASLKVSVDGEASDRDQLRAFLVDTLEGFARKDPLTHAQIHQYIERVLAPGDA